MAKFINRVGLLIGLALASPAIAAGVGPIERGELPASGSIVISLGNSVSAATIGTGLTWSGGTLSANVPSVFGRTGAVTLGSSDVISALGFTPMSLAGGTLTGSLTLTSSATVSAAGTTQGTATAIASQVNVVTTVAANTGVALPTGGAMILVLNRGANALSVYPPVGAQIEANATNAAVSLIAGGVATFVCPTSSQCYAF